MSRYQRDKYKFSLIEPIDDSLIQTLGIEHGTPKADIISLIKEYMCRRGKKCALCGKTFNRKDLTIDRRKSISHGGKDNMDNLQLLCHNCSELKGNSTMLQVRKQLRLQKGKK